ncbi:hypothetical protein AAG570_005268 [Ranatra chinensis]|uniref:Uncharacterized protein n=1 Tax=Ranatra chinensis TaxID=642074 RepID=A0ABD0Y095_9HEMI
MASETEASLPGLRGAQPGQPAGAFVTESASYATPIARTPTPACTPLHPSTPPTPSTPPPTGQFELKSIREFTLQPPPPARAGTPTLDTIPCLQEIHHDVATQHRDGYRVRCQHDNRQYLDRPIDNTNRGELATSLRASPPTISLAKSLVSNCMVQPKVSSMLHVSDREIYNDLRIPFHSKHENRTNPRADALSCRTYD